MSPRDDEIPTELYRWNGKEHVRVNKLKRRFLKGPVPLDWITAAGSLGGNTVLVSLALWFLKGVKGKLTVQMERKLLGEFGVNQREYSRAITRLESAGLIAVERRRGKTPIVTILKGKCS